MSDALADGLRLAMNHCLAQDAVMARKFLALHESGRELTAAQMKWARDIIARGAKRAGVEPAKMGFDKIDEDIFADETTHVPSEVEQRALLGESPSVPAEPVSDKAQLDEQNDQRLEQILSRIVQPHIDLLERVNDTREKNLVARQDAFNKNAAKSIAEACVAEAMRRLEARVPREVIIKVQKDNLVKAIEGVQHPNFLKLLKYGNVRKSDGYVPAIFLAGERGSGKTTGCRNAAHALGLKWYANGAISDPIEMLGYMDGNGNYHTTPFRQAFEFGGWYTFDEVDRSDPNATLAVNPHLANNEAAFPDGMVKRHKDCIITATGNTWGLGGSLEFAGANKLDEAFLSRFEIKLPWDVDRDFERKIVGNEAWMDYVAKCRQRVKDAGIKYTIDSRACIAGAAMISQLGYTHEQAAADTFLASMKQDQRRIVMGLQ